MSGIALISFICFLGQTLALLSVVSSFRGRESFILALSTVIVTSAIMQVMEYQILEFAMLSDFAKEIAKHGWYIVFAIIDLVGILTIRRLHKELKIAHSFYSNVICITYAFLTLIQVVRYFDRLVVKCNLLETAYSYSVIGMNILITIFTVFFLFSYVSVSYRVDKALR